MRPSLCTVPLLACCALLAMPAAGQIAPQPTATPEQPELAEPPAPRPIPVTTSVRAVPPPKPVIPEFVTPEPRVVNGQSTLRAEPTDLLALGHNPLIDAGVVARFVPVLSDRRREVQDLMINQPDLAEKLLDPALLEVDMSDPSSFTRFQSISGALRELGPLTSAVNAAGILDTTQRSTNQAIMVAYQNRLLGAIRSENPDAQGLEDEQEIRAASTNAVGRVLFQYAIAEAKLSYGLLAMRAFEDLDRWLADAGVSPGSAALIRLEADKVRTGTLAERAVNAAEAFQVLSPAERKALIDMAAAQRQEATFEVPEQVEGEWPSFSEISEQERVDALVNAYAGMPFDWQAYVVEGE